MNKAKASAARASRFNSVLITSQQPSSNRISDEVLLKDIDKSINEWTRKCGIALTLGQVNEYITKKNQISTLLEWRRQIKADMTSTDGTSQHAVFARESAIRLIEAQRQLNQSYSIPRTEDGEEIDSSMGLSLQRMLALHRSMQNRMQEGSVVPTNIAEQYKREMEFGLREKSARKETIIGSLHLYLDMKMAMLKVCFNEYILSNISQMLEPCRLYFSLYKIGSEFVYDEFYISLTAQGFPDDNGLLNKLQTLFMDVAREDIQNGLYLVCRIYRMGALVLDETKLSSSGISLPTASINTAKSLQRPFGVGVVNLAALNLLELPFATEFELPEAMTIYRPSHDAETLFPTLHEDIISRRESEYEVVPHSRGIALSVAVIEGIVNNECNVSNKELKMKVIEASRTFKIRQEYILDPREQREEMFVAIRSGSFSQGSKTAAKNIEISARIVGDDGTVYSNCIVRGTGKQAKPSEQYTATVYRHVNNPTIQETFRVLLPQIPNLLKCHLLITASHCSTNSGAQSSFMGGTNKKQKDLFAFAYLVFENAQGSLINNGDHFLECFTPLPGMETGSTMSACYLKGEKTRLKRRTIRAGLSQTTDEHIIVGTSVTSVTYSSVRALNNIMRWESVPESDLRAAMTTFATSNESDAIRYVRDVLDKSSRIMTQRTALASEAFTLFMNLLAVFHKNAVLTNAQDTEAVLEAYADVIFSNDRVYYALLTECNRSLAQLDSASASRSLYPIDKNIILCLPLLLHLIHIYYERCTVIDRQSTASNGMQMIDMELQDELSKMIGHLTGYLNNCDMENEVSSAIYDVYFEVFSIIETFFTFEDMSVFAGDFMCSFLRGASGHKHRMEHSSADVKRKKMLFLRNIMGTSVFDHSEARRIMLPRIVDIIIYFMPDVATRDLTCEVLQILLDKMAIMGDATDKTTSLKVLPALIIELSGMMNLLNDTNRLNLEIFLMDATCCLCTLVSMLLTDGENLLEEGIGGVDGRNIALQLLLCVTDIIKKDIVQPTWILISMTVFNTAQKLLVWMLERFESFRLLQRMNEQWELYVSSQEYELMVAEALLAGECDAIENIILYTAVFNLGYTIILEPALATHSSAMNPARKQYLTHHYNDVRDPIIDAISKAWNDVKNFWPRFCSHFTVPALAAACSSFDALRSFGKTMMLDLLRADFSRQQDFRLTAAHVYDSVRASLVEGASGGSAIELRYLAPLDAMKQFIGIELEELFKQDAVLNHPSAFLFVNEMKELLRLLMDLARCPKTPEYEEERSFAYGKLMDFLLKMDRLDAYIKCAHTLSKELENMELHTEAGNAVLLHYKLLQWRSNVLDPLELNDAVILHAAPEWQRKKYLLEEALELLEKGKCFEVCIDLLNELEMVYTKLFPDYIALTEEVLERKIVYYKSIIDADRFFPTMFRAGYYGAFDNTSIRNKEFIYRGMPLESIIDFTSRMKKKYPQCEILPPKITPTEEHFNSSTQYIQLSKVTPANVLESEGKQVDISMFPPYIRSHLTNNNVQCFYYQKPFRKRSTKSANEFLDLWVEKKFMITDVVFPSYTRRAEVTRIGVVELNPIEMAVVGLQERNADLSERNIAMRSMPDNSAAQVDAAVNGGLKNYETFITGEYRQQNPEIAEDVDSSSEKQQIVAVLKACLAEQLQLLEVGIGLHGRKCLESMKPLHDHIEVTFHKMKQELTQLLRM